MGFSQDPTQWCGRANNHLQGTTGGGLISRWQEAVSFCHFVLIQTPILFQEESHE